MFFSSRKTGFSLRFLFSIILRKYHYRLYVYILIFRAVWERIIAHIIYHISHSDPLLRQNLVLTFHIFNFAKVGIVIIFLHLIFHAYILYLLKSWQLKLRQNMVSISHFWDMYFLIILIWASAKIDISHPSLFFFIHFISYHLIYLKTFSFDNIIFSFRENWYHPNIFIHIYLLYFILFDIYLIFIF